MLVTRHVTQLLIGMKCCQVVKWGITSLPLLRLKKVKMKATWKFLNHMILITCEAKNIALSNGAFNLAWLFTHSHSHVHTQMGYFLLYFKNA